MSTRPPGDEVYELLVSGKDSVGVLNKITSVISDCKVNFVSTHGQADESGETFINAFFCDFAGAKATTEELVGRLRKLPFVTEVLLEPMKGLMFERFMFPMSLMYADRALTLGARAFVEMEQRLVEIFGTAGETMSYEQGKAYAESTMESLDKYREKVGAKWDLPNIEGLFRAEGWGIATINEVPEGYEVSVKSPPTIGRAGAPEGPGKFVVGMIVGMLRAHSGGHLAAGPVERDPAAEECRFSVKKVKHG